MKSNDEKPQMEIVPFQKYRDCGAYHWNALRNNPLVHNCIVTKRYAIVLDLAHIESGNSVLDLGCGDGALIFLAHRRVPTAIYLGVEPEATGRNLAHQMLTKHGRTVPLLPDTQAIADESQDIIICSEVIEHVPDPEHLLQDIHRMLKPGGRAVLTTPVRLTEQPYDSEHIQEFFPLQFRQLIDRHLRVIESRQCIPIFAVQLYHWRPAFFLWRGVIRWIMNILSAWFDVDVVESLNPLGRYYLTQVVTAVKSSDNAGQGNRVSIHHERE